MVPLFPQPIPVIGGTGAFESGKSLFGLTICPGKETLYYDFEQSGATYESLGHTRIDVLAEMQKLHPNGYKPIDLWIWWLKHVRSVEPGKYRVIVLDPVTDLERGLTDWVNANPHYFGHTAGQYLKMSGIMWGDMKDYMKSVLADVSTRCETLYFAAHLGREFEGNQATGRMKIKGKTTLMELASLFLWFERKPDAKGVKPNKPSARVVKSRLMSMRMVDGEVEMEQVLPPTLPVATPKTIRDAFAKPAGGREIDDTEKFVEEALSDEDKLRLQIQLAEAQRDNTLGELALKGATVTRPTAPPDNEVLQWISDAKSMAELDAAVQKIKGYDLTEQVKNVLRESYLKRKQELLKPAE